MCKWKDILNCTAPSSCLRRFAIRYLEGFFSLHLIYLRNNSVKHSYFYQKHSWRFIQLKRNLRNKTAYSSPGPWSKQPSRTCINELNYPSLTFKIVGLKKYSNEKCSFRLQCAICTLLYFVFTLMNVNFILSVNSKSYTFISYSYNAKVLRKGNLQ